MDYITELETEIFRLRDVEASLTGNLNDQKQQLKQSSQLQAHIENHSLITLHVLIQCLNGQIAPGLYMKSESAPGMVHHIIAGSRPATFKWWWLEEGGTENGCCKCL